MGWKTTAGVAAATIGTAGAIAIGGQAIAQAATPSPTPSPSTTAPSTTPPARSGDAAVTGDELARVTAAVKAHDAAVTVTEVRKDPDGSYDVLGTKAGARVMYDVSADLKTFTQNTRGGGGHGRGGSGDAAVTGDELARVTAAVKAHDAAVTVTEVRKDPDGSYDVLGTKAGARVMYDVSADLKTFTPRTVGDGGGRHGRGGSPGSEGTASGASA